MNTLDDSSRIWIYVSDRKFIAAEISELNNLLGTFCREWTVHGTQLAAEGEILHNQIIVLIADETKAGASGCSIDQSVHFIQSLEKKFSVRLFNRMLIPILYENELQVETPEKIPELFSAKKINKSTPVFNTLATTKKELHEHEFIPLCESWIFSRIAEHMPV